MDASPTTASHAVLIEVRSDKGVQEMDERQKEKFATTSISSCGTMSQNIKSLAAGFGRCWQRVLPGKATASSSGSSPRWNPASGRHGQPRLLRSEVRTIGSRSARPSSMHRPSLLRQNVPD